MKHRSKKYLRAHIADLMADKDPSKDTLIEIIKILEQTQK